MTSATVLTDVSVLTVDAARRVIDDGWVSFADGVITGVGSGPVDAATLADATVVDGRGGMVTPGLISTHDHMVDALLRGGIEQGRDLQDWLVNVNFSGLAGYLPGDARLATTVSVTEALQAGVTTVCDNWGIDNGADRARTVDCSEETLAVYRDAGTRVVFGVMFADTFPEEWIGLTDAHRCRVPSSRLDPSTLVEDTDVALRRVADTIAAHHGSAEGRITVAPAPELTQVVTREGLLGAAELARGVGGRLALHLCESDSDARLHTDSGSSLSCVDWLDVIGVLGPDLVASHCVRVTGRDIRLLARHDVKVAHVPTSNAASAQAVAPVPSMLDAGLCLGLGNDNSNLSERSVLAQMRQCVLMARATTGDPDAVTTAEAVEMATRDGARALGLEHSIGSIEVGKRADLVLFDRSGSHWWPSHDAATALVFQARPTDVRRVWVDGRSVVEDGRCTGVERPDPGTVQQAALAVLDRAGLGSLTRRGWPGRARPPHPARHGVLT